ncbi:hypothetical protein BVX94_00780 [bacterium B17]|nr:hypothetical protein BVX94_00780 [bacterium B17]
MIEKYREKVLLIIGEGAEVNTDLMQSISGSKRKLFCLNMVPSHLKDLLRDAEELNLSVSISPFNLSVFQKVKSADPDIVAIIGSADFVMDIINVLKKWRVLFDFECEIYRLDGDKMVPVKFSWQMNFFPVWVCVGILIICVMIFVLLTLFANIYVAISVFFVSLIAGSLKKWYAQIKIVQLRDVLGQGVIYESTPEKKEIRTIGSPVITNKTFGTLNTPSEQGTQIITLIESGRSYEWSWRHDQDGCRVSSEDSSVYEGKPLVAALGCSMTYGYGVNDSDTYPWVLQEGLPEYNVKNYGVNAYSLYQAQLMLEAIPEDEDLKLVILGFHENLEKRNTNCMGTRTKRTIWWKNPYCLSVGGRLKRFAPDGYYQFPGKFKPAIVRNLEYALNACRFRGRGDPLLMRKTTEHLVLLMQRTCEKRGSGFLVACTDVADSYYDFFKQSDVDWVITPVDRTIRDDKGKFPWRNYPFDNHPAPEKQREMGEEILSAAKSVLNGVKMRPDTYEIKNDAGDTSVVPEDIYPIF